jgi:hypothetical protein
MKTYGLKYIKDLKDLNMKTYGLKYIKDLKDLKFKIWRLTDLNILRT